MRKSVLFSSVLASFVLMGSASVYAQSSVLNATGGTFQGYNGQNYDGSGNANQQNGGQSQGNSSGAPVGTHSGTQVGTYSGTQIDAVIDPDWPPYRPYEQVESDSWHTVNAISGLLPDIGPGPSSIPPYALPTNLLGNETLNNIAYTRNTWVNPPWNTPYQSSADSRSWISQLPNGGQGYSPTLGFQAPYSGGHGPLVADSYSNVDITFDPLGRAGLPTAGAPYVANLFDGISSTITQAIASSINAPSLAFVQTAALVQAGILPLHFLITWGGGSSDLDLHVTGPLGLNRFHIYYAANGSLTNNPHAKLIDDCVSTNCAEVVRIEQLNDGGVYRASVFNYGDQDTSSTNLSSNSGVVMMVVRGGTVGAIQGDNDLGSIVTGGDILYQGSPTPGQAGNTWTAFEVNPETGAITFVNQMGNSAGSGSVQ